MVTTAGTDVDGEVTGLDQSIAYAEHLAEQAGAHGPDGNEGYLQHLRRAGVAGPGLASAQDMQAAFAVAAAAATAHATELGKQTSVQEQYDANPTAGDKTYLTGDAGTPTEPKAAQMTEENRPPTPGEPKSSGRPPQQPDAAGALYIDPQDGYEALGRIVKRTKSTADIEWPNGHVEKGVKFSEPRSYGTLRWLTQQQLDAEEAAQRWPKRVRGVDGLVGLHTDDDGVTITAGTAQQVAGIDPQAWRQWQGKQRYAFFNWAHAELPQLRRALGAASRAASQGKPYSKTINGSDIGDIDLTVTPQSEGDPAVTLTVRPHVDARDTEQWDNTTESSFGKLVVTLTTPMVDQLRGQLAATGGGS
jgi:hypothetical protein